MTMQSSLTKKIIGPFAILGALVLVLLAVLFGFEQRQASAQQEVRTLLSVRQNIHVLADLVKSGILTHKESYAIETAKTALEVDALPSSRRWATRARICASRSRTITRPWSPWIPFFWKTASPKAKSGSPGYWNSRAASASGSINASMKWNRKMRT